MDREALRLELLKLTYSHGRPAGEAVGRAKELEDYVLELGQTKTGLTPAGKPSASLDSSTADNDIFR
jgi:hypothetical protein